MTSTADIHAQLDAATRDTSVSIDAMRCEPAPGSARAREFAARFARVGPAAERAASGFQRFSAAAQSAGFALPPRTRP